MVTAVPKPGKRPVVLDDVPEDAYHRDPHSLSQSGAKTLTATCPAQFRHDQLHGRAPRKTFELGHAVHALVLGKGAEIVVPTDPQTGVPYAAWNTNECKRQVAEARAAGRTPLKAEQLVQAQAMAAAILAHPRARALLGQLDGVAERSVWWRDEESGAWCRARFDWLLTTKSGRHIVVDLKSAEDVSPPAFEKSIGNYGYHVQDVHYRDAVRAAYGDPDPGFIFVALAKNPPHLVTLHELDDEFLAAGADRLRHARNVFAECIEADRWPAYGDAVFLAHAPRWLT